MLVMKEIGNGGSCRNAGGVRQSARDPKELPLAMYAVANIWPHLSEELGVDVEYHQGGNLRLGLTEKDIKVLENHTAKSLKLGLDVKMISGDEAREICPYMSKEVVAASWCPTDGHANPLKATLGFYRKALELGGYSEDRQMTGINGGTTVTTGFGHGTILSVAEQVVAGVRSGAIRHFFLVGGCDGAKTGRNYYTEFVKQTPKDSIALTLACGKYRFNDLDLGTFDCLPRLMDM